MPRLKLEDLSNAVLSRTPDPRTPRTEFRKAAEPGVEKTSGTGIHDPAGDFNSAGSFRAVCRGCGNTYYCAIPPHAYRNGHRCRTCAETPGKHSAVCQCQQCTGAASAAPRSPDSVPQWPPAPVGLGAAAGKPRAKRKARGMNGTEAAFAARLDVLKHAGEVTDYRYEGMRLKWGVDERTGEAMWYKADFVVFRANLPILLVETKGKHVWSRDHVRFKGCRAAWPCFDFEMWQFRQGQWLQIR